MKEVLYEVRCLKSNEDMILALAGQFWNFSGSRDNCLNCPASARIISSFDMLLCKCEEEIYACVTHSSPPRVLYRGEWLFFSCMILIRDVVLQWNSCSATETG